MIVLGIDPGTAVTGYGIVKREGQAFKLIDFGCIRPPKKLTTHHKYPVIFDGIDFLLEKYAPEAVSVETQYVHKNVKSAITLGMARGVIILAALKRNVSVFEYAPSEAKKAVVGNGGASKSQVQFMVGRLLSLENIPEPEDAADALALAICHLNTVRYQDLLKGRMDVRVFTR